MNRVNYIKCDFCGATQELNGNQDTYPTWRCLTLDCRDQGEDLCPDCTKAVNRKLADLKADRALSQKVSNP